MKSKPVETRTRPFMVRLTAKEHATITNAARRAGLAASTFVRSVVLARVRETSHGR